jgi:pimeloyl-ACP methyl ester carboxylesterase
LASADFQQIDPDFGHFYTDIWYTCRQFPNRSFSTLEKTWRQGRGHVFKQPAGIDFCTSLHFEIVENLMRCFYSGTIDRSGHRPNWSPVRVGAVVVAVASMMMLCDLPQTFAQTAKKPVVEERELITRDELRLKITYYKSPAVPNGEDTPVVVLLHGKKGSRQQWKDLATDLQQKGDFAVVAVDLRGHGQSLLPKKSEVLKKADYQNMVSFDMEAVKEFLLEEHQKKHLNINKLGIVACDFSASVALLYTELDWEKTPYDDSPSDADKTPRGQDVQALVLITPDASTPGLVTHKSVIAVKARQRPVVICVSKNNPQEVSAATKMYEQLSPPRKDKEKEEQKEEPPYLWKYEGNLSGMDLVTRNPQIRGHIFTFLSKYVREIPSEWRDRRSRLDRE